MNKHLLSAFLLILCGCMMPQYDIEEKNDFATEIVADNSEDLIDIVNVTGADFELGRFCYQEIKRSLNDAELGYRIRLQSKKIREQWGGDQNNDSIKSSYDIGTRLVVVLIILIGCGLYLQKRRTK